MLKKTIIIILAIILIPQTVNSQNITKIYAEDYYIENENPKEYPYKDEESFIIKEYQTEEQKEEKPGRVITEKTKYGYEQLLIKYIVINGFKFENNIYLSELGIYEKEENQKINYHIECTSCEEEFSSKLKDEKLNENLETIKKGLTITIELEKEYNPENLEITLHLKNEKNIKNTIGYELWYLDFKPEIVRYTSKYNNGIAHKSEIVVTYQNIYQPVNTNINNENIKNKRYNDQIIYLDEKKESEYYNLKEEKNYYIYQDKLFKYYKIEKNKTSEEKLKEKPKHKYKKITNKEKTIKYDNTIPTNLIVTKKAQEEPIKTKEKNNNQKKSEDKKQIIQEKEIILSNNKIIKPTKSNKVLPITLVIFLLLLLLMVLTLRSLKKEQ